MCPGIISWTAAGQFCMAPWLAVMVFPVFAITLCLLVFYAQRLINWVKYKRRENGGIFWTVILILTVILLILVQIIGTIVSIIGIIGVAVLVIGLFTGKK